MRPLLFLALITALPAEPVSLSGIYPHLTMFNNEGECGTGAVVPWADRLWVVTYAPHTPKGDDSNMLYSVTRDLQQTIHPESIGGTPANRMIHDESQQLFIGPYAISADRKVRAIPYTEMFGRPTGNACHLTEPKGKILYASMEEGIYEVDVKSLAVTELWRDEHLKGGRKADFPGYHGKGFYSGQGIYVYANNGEHGKAAQQRPDIPSGVLAEWDGKADAWTIVRRNQFTEVTGPGGIHGNPNPATDPIWTIGWDAKSLLFGVRSPAPSPWTFYRLPKGSHSYDGAHGWNTEWPRIREIGEDDYLMTMHGTFWRFPKTFSPASSAGITPRSNYLKVIGDFCRWGDRLVLGCDDSAKSEFLNTHKAKGKIAGPQSQSNLWFIDPARLDQLGPAIGRGSVWVDEAVKAGIPSDPFLFSGYDHRGLHLHHDSKETVTFRLEVDRNGDGKWTTLREIAAQPGVATFTAFTPEESGTWIRITPTKNLTKTTAAFSYRNRDKRPPCAPPTFTGIAKPGNTLTGGKIRARGGNKRTLSFAAVAHDGSDIGYYELDETLQLKKTDDPKAHDFTKENTPIPSGVLTIDAASVLFTDDSGKRWRLPKGDPALTKHPLGDYRVAREVATERDLFNAHGTFYELPARNAGGFTKVRPVATHNRLVHDYCSYRGLFIISGIATDAPTDNEHILRSDDGKTALWAGAIDDVWSLGKPRGTGGPWKDTPVEAGEPSDPYLLTAYDKKSLTLTADKPATITAEIDLTGEGRWATCNKFQLTPGAPLTHTFPDAFSAYWIRFRSDTPCAATAQLEYR